MDVGDACRYASPWWQEADSWAGWFPITAYQAPSLEQVWSLPGLEKRPAVMTSAKDYNSLAFGQNSVSNNSWTSLETVGTKGNVHKLFLWHSFHNKLFPFFLCVKREKENGSLFFLWYTNTYIFLADDSGCTWHIVQGESKIIIMFDFCGIFFPSKNKSVAWNQSYLHIVFTFLLAIILSQAEFWSKFGMEFTHWSFPFFSVCLHCLELEG